MQVLTNTVNYDGKETDLVYISNPLLTMGEACA